MKMKMKEKPVKLNNVIITKVNLKSRNDIALSPGAQNNLRGDKIRLGHIYICDDAYDETLGTIFSMDDLNYDAFIMKVEIEISDYSYDVALLCVKKTGLSK